MKEKVELKFNVYFNDEKEEIEKIIIDYFKDFIKNSRNEMQKL